MTSRGRHVEIKGVTAAAPQATKLRV